MNSQYKIRSFEGSHVFFYFFYVVLSSIGNTKPPKFIVLQQVLVVFLLLFSLGFSDIAGLRNETEAPSNTAPTLLKQVHMCKH